jgi:hypothetical protein
MARAVGLSPRRSGFDHSPIHVPFVLQNMAPAQVFIRASDIKIFSLFDDSKGLARPFLMQLLYIKGRRSPYNRPRRPSGARWGGWSSRPGCFNPNKDPIPIV